MTGRRENQFSSFSSGGGGYNFEVYVQTYIAMHIIVGETLPFFDTEKPVKMKLQGHYDGYDTDDCIVFGENGGKILCQIKHSVTVSMNNDIFHEVITDAWSDFTNTSLFNRETDSIVLIVAGLSKSDIDNTRVLFQWSRDCEDEKEFIKKVTTPGFSSKDKKKKFYAIREQLQSANGSEISDYEIWDFFRHFNLQILELDYTNSPLFLAVSNLLARTVGQGGMENVLYRYMAGYNQNAGTVTRDKMLRDLHLENMINNRNITKIGYEKTGRINHKKLECAICEALRNHIEAINRDKGCEEINEKYVPIEIQVEEMLNEKPNRRNADLLAYLKHTSWYFSGAGWNWMKRIPKKTVYLVLGNPGSGKSVALRKLCLDLLKTVTITKRIPVYIDLGKWNGLWTALNPPKMEDLICFIKQTITDDINSTGLSMDMTYIFDEMLEKGRWLFVFDSFDEIPCLMGTGNNQMLIATISKLIHDFLTNGKQGGGIVASRYNYNKELQDSLAAKVKLEIKEFDDIRIKTMLNNYLNNAFDVVDKLFREREDLVALCRNPFYLSLLIGYIRDYGTKFPKKQVDLYRHFLNSRLNKNDCLLKEYELTKDDVIIAAKRLSVFILQSSVSGLECPINDFRSLYYEREKGINCIRLLKQIGLCHVSEREGTVSFVHRRFQEYFLALSFKETYQSKESIIDPDFGKIINNSSSLQDTLALYCEIADEDKAKEIALYCWKSLKDKISYNTSIDEDGGLILYNNLCFMANAFRNRREAIQEFADEYEKIILDNFDDDTHFIIQVAMLKGLILFNPDGENIIRLALRTFTIGNNWLNDVMMENCRLIKNVDDRIETQFTFYLYRKTAQEFLKQFRNTDFALSKAQGFRYVRCMHLLQLVNILLMIFFIAHNLIALSLMEFFGFPLRVMEIELKTGMMFSTIISKIDEESLIELIEESHAIGLFMLFIYVFWITKLKTRPVKDGEINRTCPLETLFSGMLFMTPIFSILFTVIKNKMGVNPIFIKAYIAVSVVILVTIIAINIPYAVHDSYYYFKNYGDTLSKRDICIQLIKPAIRSIIFTLVIGCSVLLIPSFLMNSLGIIISALIIIMIPLSLIGVLRYYTKKHFLDHISIPQNIEIEELVNNLEKISINELQIIYLNRLLDNTTCLYGEWPDKLKNKNGCRKKYENDDVEAAISKLEYESMIERKNSNRSNNT